MTSPVRTGRASGLRRPARFAVSGNSRGQRRARGMTLLEVLCAILVMTIGLLGLVSLTARASQASTASDDGQRAAILANELATSMWLKNDTAVSATELAAWNQQVADATGLGLPSGSIAVAYTGKVARITVTWRPPELDSKKPARQYFTDVRLN